MRMSIPDTCWGGNGMKEGQDHSEIQREVRPQLLHGNIPARAEQGLQKPSRRQRPGGFTRWSRRAAGGPSNAGDSRSAVRQALGHGLEASFWVMGDRGRQNCW